MPDKGESLLAKAVDLVTNTPESFVDFMSKFDSGYLKDYSNLLTTSTNNAAKEAYLNRWRNLLKYAPAVAVSSTIGATMSK